MNVLDLFSGIGGFSLGLERAGMRTVAFCEIDPYCRAVLARHWPGVPIYGDIRQVDLVSIYGDMSRLSALMADATGERIGLRGDHGSGTKGRDTSPGRLEVVGGGSSGIDVICGGFPCQDISVAGKGAGLAGARSGLWREYHRLIRELRPRYVIVENVSALLSRGLEQVLGDLAEIGYDAEWHCIPASYVGAPHRRDRVWIVAYPQKLHSNGRFFHGEHAESEVSELGNCSCPKDVADAEHGGRSGRDAAGSWPGSAMSHGWWESEPDVGRVAHGVPKRVDRLRALGNAVVPQVVEIIGRAIMRAET